MNVTREITALNELEASQGVSLDASWHNDYRDTSWVFVGNLDYELTEGDVICLMSQFGEIEDIHVVRDKDTNKRKGFAFVKYEDWRSTVLAVDNFTGAELLGRTLRVDHTRYERPKKKRKEEEALTLDEKRALAQPGHAYIGNDVVTVGSYSLSRGQNVFAAADADEGPKRKRKKKKKMKSKESKKKRRRNED